jgi:predicted AlkP superfamily pyrophosphatase or phosphodiesterase
MRNLIRIIAAVLILSATLHIHAQVSTSGIGGKVINSDGLPLSGAKVVATHVPSGTLFAAISDQEGKFRLPGLSIGGPYSVKVSLTGYKPYILSNIYLILGNDYVIDASLKVKELTVRRRDRNRDTVLVILSMDGFRWDYPVLYHTPNLDRIAKTGVKAESLQPCFPTKTFPNHYSIATGLYPDHHGIVQNSFYDPRLDRVFRMGDRSAVEDSVFWEGEAIWETAEMQGVRTASFFWVGTESNERYHPEQRKNYQEGFPFGQQIDTVMSWLSLPVSQRPGMVMFYFDEPDKVSHSFGPVCPQTRATVESLDSLVGVIIRKLHQVEKAEHIGINLMIVSDHGMGNVPEGNSVFLEDILDLKRIKRINGGNPVINLEPEPGYLDEATRLLKATLHIKTWTRSGLPASYHYGTNPRIPELIIEADSSYGLEIRRKAGIRYSGGTHGYDPRNRDMHGIFYATGPAFKTGFVQPTFENVAIYVLIARIIGIKPAKTDGDFNTIKGVLKGY